MNGNQIDAAWLATLCIRNPDNIVVRLPERFPTGNELCSLDHLDIQAHSSISWPKLSVYAFGSNAKQKVQSIYR